MLILHNHKNSNNHRVAKKIASYFNCECTSVSDNPNLEDFETITFVMGNTGDEELPQPMEDFLLNLKTRNKKYLICEIGNYFGLESYVGCKKIASRMLNDLDWTKVSDISLDSVPDLDLSSLDKWLAEQSSKQL